MSRRARESGVEGKVDEQEHICGDAGEKRFGDKVGTDERRVEVRTSLTSRVDKVVGAGSDRISKGQRGGNDDCYDGHRKGGDCHDDGYGLHKDAGVENCQRRDAFIPVRNYKAGGATCKDLFARFVYSQPVP